MQTKCLKKIKYYNISFLLNNIVNIQKLQEKTKLSKLIINIFTPLRNDFEDSWILNFDHSLSYIYDFTKSISLTLLLHLQINKKTKSKVLNSIIPI